jgi:hypothetical protein
LVKTIEFGRCSCHERLTLNRQVYAIRSHSEPRP